MGDILPGVEAAPNIHPMFVHFPIALWAVALLFWGLGAFRKNDQLFQFGSWLLYLGTASAIATIVTGLVAADGLGHDSVGHDVVHTHRNFMFVASGVAAAVTAAAFVWRKSGSATLRWALLAGLAATNAVAALGADRGVVIVYGASDTADGGHGDAAKPDNSAH